MRDYLKKKLGVPENWDKYDYQTQRYSFEDIEEILQTYKDEQLLLHNVSQQREYFYKVCDELEKLIKQLIPPNIKSLVVDKVLVDIGGVMLLLPSDDETEKWFEENIGVNSDCSASSAIYKFRLWLKDRLDTDTLSAIL